MQLQEEPHLLEADLQQRDREVTEIARSITQLAELFRDLSAMVISQGSLLDSIEYNIDQTAVNMEEAVRDLDVAEKYVSSKLCYSINLQLVELCFGSDWARTRNRDLTCLFPARWTPIHLDHFREVMAPIHV